MGCAGRATRCRSNSSPALAASATGPSAAATSPARRMPTLLSWSRPACTHGDLVKCSISGIGAPGGPPSSSRLSTRTIWWARCAASPATLNSVNALGFSHAAATAGSRNSATADDAAAR